MEDIKLTQYLDKFAGTIGKRQSEQILKLLNRKRNTGQIRSVKEFTERLADLMRELTSTVLQPSLKLWYAEEDDLISSERYNFMLDRVQDDLEAAFEEALKIDEVQKSHEAIVRDIILKNLRAGVAEVESKITLFEFLNKDLRGFDSAIFSTFRESKKGRTQRGVAGAQILFVDPRLNDLIPVAEDATIELVGERLTLPASVISFHNIRGIRQIFDDSTPQSELAVEPAGVDLKNLIDNTKGTYWIQSLLFSSLRSYAKTKLELDLGGVREINFIEIEPASKHGLILETVHYMDSNNIATSLELPEQTISAPVSMRIRKTATDRLILTFRNENATQVQFEYSEGDDTLFAQALSEPTEGYSKEVSSASSDLDEILASAQIKEIIGVSTLPKSSFTGFEFVTGFDNINVGLASFEPRGIYLSEPLKIENMGEVGLKTLESRPYIPVLGDLVQFTSETYNYDSENEIIYSGASPVSGRVFRGSIEYWITRQDLMADDTLLRTTVFPIMPLGVQRIHQERLLLTGKSSASLVRNDLGQTIFFTNRTSTEGNIQVHRNGIPLDDETENDSAIDGWKHYDVGSGPSYTPDPAYISPNSGTPMAFRIQIVDPLPGDIFTVSYAPLTSSTRTIPTELNNYDAVGGLKVVDLVGDLSARLEEGKIIILDEPAELTGVVKTRIYLSIILRQNTAEQSSSPAIEEYTLVAGYKDEAKFRGD